jgi:hypothetical protein
MGADRQNGRHGPHLQAHLWITLVPEQYLLGDKALYIEAMRNSIASYSRTGIIDPSGMESTRDMLVRFDPDFKSAAIDLPKTFVDRFAQQAEAGAMRPIAHQRPWAIRRAV